MTAPLDVLAVMDEAREYTGGWRALSRIEREALVEQMKEARAAVAELVEQARVTRLLLANVSATLNISGFTQQIADLDAALAKFGGAA